MWIAVIGWIAVVVLALVVLGFCAYEIDWKTKRLRADAAALQLRAGELQDLAQQFALAQARIPTTIPGRGTPSPGD